jgi:FkbM family methyltransferase
MERQIHAFDNGVRVFDDQLVPGQRERYQIRNVHESEEEDIFVELIQALPANGCFIDIGSAIGYYVLLAKKLSPQLVIHAVEPLERHRMFFLENMTLNGLSPTDFTIHKEGIYSVEGEQRLVDNGYASVLFGALGRVSADNASVKEAVKSTIKRFLARAGLKKFDSSHNATLGSEIMTIQTITLGDLLDTVGGAVELLQMDVQGAEADILKSSPSLLQAGKIKTFLIGTHSRAIHRECIAILRGHGYEIEYEEPNPKEQPDGIVVATKGTRRLKVRSES